MKRECRTATKEREKTRVKKKATVKDFPVGAKREASVKGGQSRPSVTTQTSGG